MMRPLPLPSRLAVRAAVRRRASGIAANVVSLTGLVTFCGGLWLWSPALALVAGGLALVVVAEGIGGAP